MRGTDETTVSLFSYVDLEERIPVRDPLRKVRQIVNDALASLDTEFDTRYSAEGRPSIAPERLLRASLIQILFSVRSERQLMEQMQYNLLLRWFVGLGIDDPVWVPTVFTKNRDRLLTTDMSRKFLAARWRRCYLPLRPGGSPDRLSLSPHIRAGAGWLALRSPVAGTRTPMTPAGCS
jgi:transposase